jgi:hypothetical protein
MQYVAAFIILMSLGLGVNYLMMNFVRNRLNAKNKTEPEEDPLSRQMKEEIDAETEGLKNAIRDLLVDIETKAQDLDRRETQLNELVRCADERIKELAQLKCEPADRADCESVKSDRQQDFRKVYELHQKGLNAKDIARNLGIGVGEVELKLGLLSKVR